MEAVTEDAEEFTDLLPGGLLKFPEVRDPMEAVAEDAAEFTDLLPGGLL